MKASALRKGSVIDEKGDLYIVVEMDHRTPGNYRACYQVYIKNLKDGRVIKQRYNPDDEVNEARLEAQNAQYLYHDDSGYHFMDMETYDTVILNEESVGDAKNYIKENSEIKFLYYNNKPVSIELPPRIDLTVTEAPVGLRGDTEGTARKQITVETGYKLNVPLFIKEGDVIRIDTSTGEYVGRA
ncbi:MAG: elongation factor P [Candidatus Omnitrophica bacterium]|nr:elongation factor P [Candidatus Omnitrophota bacterium]